MNFLQIQKTDQWMPHFLPPSALEMFLGAAVSLLFAFIAYSFNPIEPIHSVGVYLSMADDPFHYQLLPYGARILTPLLAHCIHANPVQGFAAVTFAFFWLTGFVLYIFLRQMRIALPVSLALLAGFFFSPTIQILFERPVYVDAISHFCMIAMVWGAWNQNPGVVMGALAIGAFNRPASILNALLPLVLWWKNERPLASLVPVALCAIPALVIIALIRFVWPEVSDYRILFGEGDLMQYQSVDIQAIFEKHGFAILLSPKIYQEMLPYLWGPALLGLWMSPMRIRAALLLHAALCAAPMMVANDFFRLPFYAFPAVYIAAGCGFVALQNRSPAWLYGTLAVCGLHLAIAPKIMWPGLLLGILLIGALSSGLSTASKA